MRDTHVSWPKRGVPAPGSLSSLATTRSDDLHTARSHDTAKSIASASVAAISMHNNSSAHTAHRPKHSSNSGMHSSEAVDAHISMHANSSAHIAHKPKRSSNSGMRSSEAVDAHRSAHGASTGDAPASHLQHRGSSDHIMSGGAGGRPSAGSSGAREPSPRLLRMQKIQEQLAHLRQRMADTGGAHTNEATCGATSGAPRKHRESATSEGTCGATSGALRKHRESAGHAAGGEGFNPGHDIGNAADRLLSGSSVREASASGSARGASGPGKVYGSMKHVRAHH